MEIFPMKRYVTIIECLVLCLGIVCCITEVTAAEPVQTASQPSTREGVSGGDFFSYASKTRSIQYTVEYELTTVFEGNTSKGKWVEYSDKDRFRIDSFMSNTESRVYRFPDAMYNCYGKSLTCIKTGPFGYGRVVDKAVAERDKFEITPTAKMAVAGTTADCFKMTDKDMPGTTIVQCFSKEGVPLYERNEGRGAASEFKAVSFTLKVNAGDFVPPSK